MPLPCQLSVLTLALVLSLNLCPGLVQGVRPLQAIRDPYSIHDYKDHPCRRPCDEKAPPMLCRYYFLVEHYSTLSEACDDCPDNTTSCFLPQCVAADGVFRGILTVNRMIPGPTIYVCKHDTVEVVVNNRMDLGEGTSIHWHGLKQKDSPHMDGTSMVTQCPILTWGQMKYRFKAADSGTHFWHAHSTIQRSDGLFGGLVIRDPPTQDKQAALYDLDLPEHYILLSDWMKHTAGEMYSNDFHGGIRALPVSILINGIGSSQEGPAMPLSVFQVSRGLRYRFRVAYNGILNCPIRISIDDHSLIMITSDGQAFEPLEVDGFYILSGERYDFVLETKKESRDNFWIRLKGYDACGVMNIQQNAILRYEGAPNESPTTNFTYSHPVEPKETLNDIKAPCDGCYQVVDLDSLEHHTDPDIASVKPDKQFYIALGASELVDPRFHVPHSSVAVEIRPISQQLNYISSMLPPSPPLSQLEDIRKEILCNNDTIQKDCTQEICMCVHMLNLHLGDVIELVLLSFKDGVSHPMHMHGHSFSVVAMHSARGSFIAT